MSFNNEVLVDMFLNHVRYLHIAHHVEGRIRVKAGWDAVKKLGNVESDQIEQVIGMLPGIDMYRVNKKALSVIIEYDPGILPYSLWEDIGRLSEEPMHRDEVRDKLLDILRQSQTGQE